MGIDFDRLEDTIRNNICININQIEEIVSEDTIRDNIEINISQVEEIIKEHMDDQPYRAICSECGNSLDVFIYKIDESLDIFIEVEPCIFCSEKGD